LDNTSSRLHTMTLGRLSHPSCSQDGRCESCDTDLEFMNDIKEVLTQFRNKFNEKG
jgi:hypothetical protein